MDAFDRNLSGSSYWLYAWGDGFHTLDPDRQEKPFIDALVRPFARAVPGRIVSTSFDLETRTFTLEAEVDPLIEADGEIFIAERHYPDGFTLTGCDEPGCRWEWEEGAQHLTFEVDEAGTLELAVQPD